MSTVSGPVSDLKAFGRAGGEIASDLDRWGYDLIEAVSAHNSAAGSVYQVDVETFRTALTALVGYVRDVDENIGSFGAALEQLDGEGELADVMTLMIDLGGFEVPGDDEAAGEDLAERLRDLLQSDDPDEQEVTDLMTLLQILGADEDFSESFTRELGPEDAREMFVRLLDPYPDGIPILADVIASGLDGYSDEELDEYLREMDEWGVSSEPPYVALILMSARASGRTYIRGIEYIQTLYFYPDNPFAQFFDTNYPLSEISEDLTDEQVDEIAEHLDSVDEYERRWLVDELITTWDIDWRGASNDISYDDMAEYTGPQVRIISEVLQSLADNGSDEALDDFIDQLADGEENEQVRGAVLREFLSNNGDYLSEELAAFVYASEGYEDGTERLLHLLEYATRHSTGAEDEELFSGVLQAALEDRSGDSAAEVVGGFIRLVDLAQDRGSGFDATAVTKRAIFDMIEAIPVIGDGTSTVGNYVWDIVEGRGTDSMSLENAIAEGDREQVYNILAMAVVLDGMNENRAEQVVASIANDYDGDVGAFLADQTEDGARFHGAAERIRDTKRVIETEAEG